MDIVVVRGRWGKRGREGTHEVLLSGEDARANNRDTDGHFVR